jgi:hypothetical protein
MHMEAHVPRTDTTPCAAVFSLGICLAGIKSYSFSPILGILCFFRLRDPSLIPSNMDNIQYPARAFNNNSRRLRGSEREDQLIEDATLSRYGPNQNSLSRWSQRYSSSSRFPGDHSLVWIDPHQAHEYILPLYHQRSTNIQPSLAREAATDTVNQTHQSSGIRYRDGAVQQRSDEGDAEGQGVPTLSSRKKPVRSTSKSRPSENLFKNEHQKCKDEVQEVLKSMFSDDCSDSVWLLLCWGKPDRCQVLPTRISHSADDVEKWHKIRKAWYEHRGGWRERISYFGVQEVSLAEVSIGNCLPGQYRY